MQISTCFYLLSIPSICTDLMAKMILGLIPVVLCRTRAISAHCSHKLLSLELWVLVFYQLSQSLHLDKINVGITHY
jgi:hypothetical protein